MVKKLKPLTGKLTLKQLDRRITRLEKELFRIDITLWNATH